MKVRLYQEKKSLRTSSIATIIAIFTPLTGGLMNTCYILRNRHAEWRNAFILDTIIFDRQMITSLEPSQA